MTGLPHLIREMRYKEFYRQAIGIVLMPVYALLADPQPAAFFVGATLALAGMLIRLYASGFIIKNKQLATVGPYSLVRHPLYTGNLLLIAGFTFASGQWWALIVSVCFWWFYYPPAVDYEDRKLHGVFGADWEQWSEITPAIIPESVRLLSGGEWSFRTSLKQNYEPVIVVYTLVWLCVIGWQLG
jgi:protein-S-isoprenylcysteine O-methyltransferase Ste14